MKDNIFQLTQYDFITTGKGFSPPSGIKLSDLFISTESVSQLPILVTEKLSVFKIFLAS